MCFRNLIKALFPRSQFEDESRQPLLTRTDDHCPDSGMGSSESSPVMTTTTNTSVVDDRLSTPQFTPNLASPYFSQLERMLQGGIGEQESLETLRCTPVITSQFPQLEASVNKYDISNRERLSTPQLIPDLTSPQFSQLESMIKEDLKQWTVETTVFGRSPSPQSIIQEVHEKKSLTNKICRVESILQKAGNILESLDNAVHGRNEQIVKAEANEKIDEFIKENDILRPKMELVVKKEECNENSASVVIARNVILERKLNETQEALAEANQILNISVSLFSLLKHEHRDV